MLCDSAGACNLRRHCWHLSRVRHSSHCFDAFTVFDPRLLPLGRHCIPITQPARGSWRARQFGIHLLRTMTKMYVDFRRVTEERSCMPRGQLVSSLRLTEGAVIACLTRYHRYPTWRPLCNSIAAPASAQVRHGIPAEGLRSRRAPRHASFPLTRAQSRRRRCACVIAGGACPTAASPTPSHRPVRVRDSGSGSGADSHAARDVRHVAQVQRSALCSRPDDDVADSPSDLNSPDGCRNTVLPPTSISPLPRLRFQLPAFAPACRF